ncbi:MAG: hypothetical protein AUH39_01930 [Chloroflexi bacterium 13_1_40CM_67_9]|nr:MAG: hypothetical protein AUH39_01930 [Chloroflexi bacterium 13_1_40CM_67_9]
MSRALIGLSLALLAFRVLSAAFVVGQPGFTDAFYYVDVARRLAHGQGLTADFIWNFLEAPHLDQLPVASHRFWMPLATVVQATGIAVLEPVLGAFRSAQAAIIAVAAFVPAIAYAAARSIGTSFRAALVAATLAGLGGGAFAPAWVTLDSFAIAALIGTAFFITFPRAAAGDARAGAASGLLVGLLFLARAEGALFGLALLALALRPSSRAAGAAGSAVALGIGAAWLLRGFALGGSPDLLARTLFLVRYEDFFAITPTGTADLATIVTTRLGALVSDLGNAVFALMAFLAFPLALGVRDAWRRPAVRAFAGLALLIYVAEGVVWPLHATRGSYFHSLAAFYPFAMALVALGGERWLAGRDVGVRRLAVGGTLAAAVALATVALSVWDMTFNGGYRARVAALEAIPSGPFLAIDGAAWRWIADRPVFVTPADGLDAAACVAARYAAKSVVLEATHFSAYEPLYRGDLPPWLAPPVERGGVRIYAVRGDIDIGCSFRALPDTGGRAAVP